MPQHLPYHQPFAASHLSQDLRPFYEACAAKARSPSEARPRLDALAGQHVESLRRLVKRVQDARWAGDQAAAAAGVAEYEQALEAYIPGWLRGGLSRRRAAAFLWVTASVRHRLGGVRRLLQGRGSCQQERRSPEVKK